jgi:ketol-acid reductoisomerase
MCHGPHTPGDRNRSILGRVVGILGYGNQGRAQALNLRDAGVDVRVGARPGGRSEAAAGEDGFAVSSPGSLGDSCDLAAILTPDETHGTVLASLIGGKRVKSVVVAHGYAIRFAGPVFRDDWDVLLVAPSGPGTALRRAGRPGRIPALIAVHQDSSGHGWQKAREYAVASGCSEGTLLETTVAEEAEVDLFGEQAVLCGGVAALVTAAWETLVDQGYDPAIAYLECVHQIGLTSEMITRHGVAGMRERISRTALFGDLTRGPRLIGPKVRARMAESLNEIRSGRFAKEWSEEVAAGLPLCRDGLERTRNHPLEEAGTAVRDLSGRATPEPEASGPVDSD